MYLLFWSICRPSDLIQGCKYHDQKWLFHPFWPKSHIFYLFKRPPCSQILVLGWKLLYTTCISFDSSHNMHETSENSKSYDAFHVFDKKDKVPKSTSKIYVTMDKPHAPHLPWWQHAPLTFRTQHATSCWSKLLIKVIKCYFWTLKKEPFLKSTFFSVNMTQTGPMHCSEPPTRFAQLCTLPIHIIEDLEHSLWIFHTRTPSLWKCVFLTLFAPTKTIKSMWMMGSKCRRAADDVRSCKACV